MRKIALGLGILTLFVLSACAGGTQNVEAVEELESLSVPQFTAFDNLELPETVDVTLEDGEKQAVRVAWDGARGRYATDRTGSYTLQGDLIMSGEKTNRDDRQAAIEVVVFAEDVASTLIGASGHGVLLQGLKNTGLDEDLHALDALTLLAPTDEAFRALAEGLGLSTAELLEADYLEEILRYHVLERTQSQSALAGFTPMLLTTMQGEDLRFSLDGDLLAVNNTAVATGREFQSSNGNIIVIDGVLVPPTVLGTIGTDLFPDDWTSLFFDLIASGDIPLDLLDRLDPGNLDGGVTVFAPNEEAIGDLAENIGIPWEGLLQEGAFLDILMYHVVLEAYLASELMEEAPFDIVSIQGESVPIRIVEGRLAIGGANLVSTEDLFGFGTIHTIDAVLIPPSFAEDWYENSDE